MPDPFISPLMLIMTPALSAQVRNGVLLTFEVNEVPFWTANRLALADDHCIHHLLSQLGLTLLDRAQEHVTHGSGWQVVDPRTDSRHGKQVQVLGSSVVGAVHG